MTGIAGAIVGRKDGDKGMPVERRFRLYQRVMMDYFWVDASGFEWGPFSSEAEAVDSMKRRYPEQTEFVPAQNTQFSEPK